MDVLKEIAQAEGRARDIEREFTQKAVSLANATREHLARAREDSEKTLENELASLRADLDRALEQEKKKVLEASRETQATLERQVRENTSRAIQLVLKEIGL
jgi:vacuolar-type H+-ATPase subunit H